MYSIHSRACTESQQSVSFLMGERAPPPNLPPAFPSSARRRRVAPPPPPPWTARIEREARERGELSALSLLSRSSLFPPLLSLPTPIRPPPPLSSENIPKGAQGRKEFAAMIGVQSPFPCSPKVSPRGFGETCQQTQARGVEKGPPLPKAGSTRGRQSLSSSQLTDWVSSFLPLFFLCHPPMQSTAPNRLSCAHNQKRERTNWSGDRIICRRICRSFIFEKDWAKRSFQALFGRRGKQTEGLREKI